MFSTTKIQLKMTRILQIPLNSYGEFSFIVNGEEFKTSQIISDLLSEKICQIHSCDPTFNEFSINTINKGDFTNILNLINFEQIIIPENEVSFLSEVFEILGNNSIVFDRKSSKITEENVIELLEKHQKFPVFYSKSLFDEINFISKIFYKILEFRQEEMKNIDLNILERIINNQKIVLKDEDQLLDFINRFYSNDSKYSNLYEYVLFQNVEISSINEFLNIYNINDLTSQTWRAVSNRLKQKIDKNVKNIRKSRYRVVVLYIYFK